jgi:hypothetical protein
VQGQLEVHKVDGKVDVIDHAVEQGVSIYIHGISLKTPLLYTHSSVCMSFNIDGKDGGAPVDREGHHTDVASTGEMARRDIEMDDQSEPRDDLKEPVMNTKEVGM